MTCQFLAKKKSFQNDFPGSSVLLSQVILLSISQLLALLTRLPIRTQPNYDSNKPGVSNSIKGTATRPINHLPRTGHQNFSSIFNVQVENVMKRLVAALTHQCVPIEGKNYQISGEIADILILYASAYLREATKYLSNH